MLTTILIGFVCCRYRFLSFDSVAPLNLFLLDLCFCPLIMRASAVRDLSSVSFMPFAIGTCTSLTLYLLFGLTYFMPFKDRFYMYLSSSLPSIYINYLIVGLPIFNAIWNEEENVMIAVLALANDLITLPTYLILSNVYNIQRANRDHIAANDGQEEKFSIRILGRIFFRLITNPIVIGNVAGFCYAATKFRVFPLLADLLKYLGDSVLAFSLFCVGGFLSQHSLIACHWAHFLVCLLIRHFAMPTLMGLYSWAFKISGKLARQCVLMGCCPSATASYLLSDQAQTGPGVASTMIFWTTMCCVPCQILWLYVFDKFGLFLEE